MTDAADPEQTKEIICAICYESPKNFGLMVSCDHIFCLGCISIWRREGQIRSLSGLKKRRLCPVCRTYSELVVETSNYLTHGKEKDDLVKGYVHKLAKTPCQYFEKSPWNNRHCPFGDSCYYQHLAEDGLVYSFSARARERARRLSIYERASSVVRQPPQNSSAIPPTRHEESSILSSLVNFFSTTQHVNPSLTESNVNNGLEERRSGSSLDVQNLESPDSSIIFLMTMPDL